MAASSFFLTAFILFPLAFASNSPPLPSINRIYVFGNSLFDTGNLLRLPGGRFFFPADRLPYGETYFHKPTGRFSDGRLIIDYIASALNLPFLDPYLNPNGSIAHGVNFAVGGATALDQDFFKERNITISNFKPPLSKQIEWFERHLNNTCMSRVSCSRRLQDSRFVFEFGVNDYVAAFGAGKSAAEVRSYVPHIVAAIVEGVKRLVRIGARRVLVPGAYPLGCMPSTLTSSSSNASEPSAYDRLGCLKASNAFSSYFNRYLRRALSREFSGSGVVIVYGDCEGALLEILRKAELFGFDEGSLLKACCGAGGKYNFDGAKPCGTNGTTMCADPGRAVHWDGAHLTDAANRRISQILIALIN